MTVAQPATRIIHFRTGNGPLIGNISSLIVQVTSNKLKIEYVASLMKLLERAEDAEVWRIVFNLLASQRTHTATYNLSPTPNILVPGDSLLAETVFDR